MSQPANQVREEYVNNPDHWRQFDRQVHVVRNPIDAIFSYFHFRHSHSHEDRVDVDILGADERQEVLRLARRWVAHADYWEKVPLQSHELRYEDLRSSPLPSLMGVLGFLLPSNRLPSLEQLSCAPNDFRVIRVLLLTD